MKFVIILLAFFIPLLTSTGALMCYSCSPNTANAGAYTSETSDPNFGKSGHDCLNLTGISGSKCKDAGQTYCVTWFSSDGAHVQIRDCFNPNKNSSSTYYTVRETNFVEKPGCQKLQNKVVDVITHHICLCNTDDCNTYNKSPLNPFANKTCKIVGMSVTRVTTLLGGVLALSLMKYL